MKRFATILISIILLNTCGYAHKCLDSPQKPHSSEHFTIELPNGYVVDDSREDYQLISALKYVGNDLVGFIEVVFSDDWSFSILQNKDYIDSRKGADINEIQSQLEMAFSNVAIIKNDEAYFLGLGDCMQFIYSGNHYEDGLRQTVCVIQFIKNQKLYTIRLSTYPKYFAAEYKNFLKALDSVKF